MLLSQPGSLIGNEDDMLCKDCADLDLEQSFARAFALYDGARRETNTRTKATYCQTNGPSYLADFHYVTSLGDRLSENRDCKLCDFLKLLTAEPTSGTYKLLAFCSSESYLFEPGKLCVREKGEPLRFSQIDHNVFMAVVPEVPLIPKTGIPLSWLDKELPLSGSIYRLTQSWEEDNNRTILPRELSVHSDFVLMQQWLSGCRNFHARICAPRKPVGTPLPVFRAINCFKKPPVVEDLSWPARYVTLSYVWGPPSGDWPQTILDAVEVTQRLGEQYLWVDRLCIDQSNLEEKHIFVSRMDDIYAGAEFTIVAAAGDARTGLPGVSTTPRKLQPRVELEQPPRSRRGMKAKTVTLASDPFLEFVGVREEEYDSDRRNGQKLPDKHRDDLDDLEGGRRINLDSRRIEKPLPPSKIAGKLILVSVLQDSRITIQNSEWATRGWTYQEGVLSTRRIFFTGQQVYWECNGMSMSETIDFPLGIVHHPSRSGLTCCTISGTEPERRRPRELGFDYSSDDAKVSIAGQVLKLDSHISAFTRRKLSYDGDSFNAFSGIAARYLTDCGLSLLLGMPIWTGALSDGKHGLQHTFALSISDWLHTAQPIEDRSKMYVADCPRRAQFPSWTWAGWNGAVNFSTTIADDHERFYEFSTHNGDIGHGSYFEMLLGIGVLAKLCTIDQVWSAEMILQDADSTESTLLSSWAPVSKTGNTNKRWLLTIRKPLVLRHMYLMHSIKEGEWRRLMGMIVHVHLSVPMTESELITGHKSGRLVSVLVFVNSISPDNPGVARFLILRMSDREGTRWERVGSLKMLMQEGRGLEYRDIEKSISRLPIRKFGSDITLI